MFNAKEWVQTQVQIVEDRRELPATKLFTPSFMRKHTDYVDIRVFHNDAMTVRKKGALLDDFVRDNTFFETWWDMHHAAYEEAFFKQG